MAPTESPGREPVLPAQHGMIRNYLRFPDDGVDVLQVTLDWTSPLEREPFEAAWHAAARAGENGEPGTPVVEPSPAVASGA